MFIAIMVAQESPKRYAATSWPWHLLVQVRIAYMKSSLSLFCALSRPVCVYVLAQQVCNPLCLYRTTIQLSAVQFTDSVGGVKQCWMTVIDSNRNSCILSDTLLNMNVLG